MIDEQIHLNDIGTRFEATIKEKIADGTLVVVDLTGATVIQLIFFKADGISETKSASFSTDGSDGKIKYLTLSGDIDQIGIWQIQAHITIPAGDWRSNIEDFRVYRNL